MLLFDMVQQENDEADDVTRQDDGNVDARSLVGCFDVLGRVFRGVYRYRIGRMRGRTITYPVD